MTDVRSSGARIEGLDLARALAFLGMIIVNFTIVMQGADEVEGGGAAALFAVLQGKAAASFVLLAGIGLGLATRGRGASVVVRRGIFLLAVGLLNALVFPADILHFYGLYFLLAAGLLACSQRVLLAVVALVNVVATVLLVFLDYERGWNWATLDYVDFWEPSGFVRHLLFNGFHPVFPWIGFLILGLVIARMELRSRSVQVRLLATGAVLVLCAWALSSWLQAQVWESEPELLPLFDTAPMPPTLLYFLSGTGSALLLVAGSLLGTRLLERLRLAGLLTPLGRQTLTWYVAHVILGMGAIEALGLMNAATHEAALLASALFFLVAMVGAHLWNRRWQRGPLEELMRRIAG